MNDVVQLDPAHCRWGALLAIVEEVREWGIVCYALIPQTAGEPPGRMYMRVNNGEYFVVGRAEWVAPKSE